MEIHERLVKMKAKQNPPNCLFFAFIFIFLFLNFNVLLIFRLPNHSNLITFQQILFSSFINIKEICKVRSMCLNILSNNLI